MAPTAGLIVSPAAGIMLMRNKKPVRRVCFFIFKLLLLFAAALPPGAWALTNNLALTPPMGWNDWNIYHCGISEAAVTNTANVMAANGIQAAGYQFVNIDD